MNITREEVQRVLYALEYHLDQTRPIPSTQDAIFLLQSKLAEKDDVEPVATISITRQGSTRTIDNNFHDCVRDWPDGEYKLFTHPAKQTPTTDVVAMVNQQSEDEGLWFEAVTAPEAYLQKALRGLHATIEGTK